MSLTLGELRNRLAALDDLPDDTLVVLAKDGEGNGYSPLEALEEGRYLPENTWSGEHYMTEEQRLAQSDPDDYDPAPEEAVQAVFLWPVN